MGKRTDIKYIPQNGGGRKVTPGYPVVYKGMRRGVLPSKEAAEKMIQVFREVGDKHNYEVIRTGEHKGFPFEIYHGRRRARA